MTLDVRALNIHYSNMTLPNLRLVRGPQDLATLQALTSKKMDSFRVRPGGRVQVVRPGGCRSCRACGVLIKMDRVWCMCMCV